METNTTHIKDVFEEMMPYIRANYSNDGEAPYFMYGRTLEVLQLLTEKDESDDYKFKKYPLIILYHGQQERHGVGVATNYLYSPLISIVTDSNREFRTATRYENTLEPVLYPIMQYLIQEIADNPNFYQSYDEEIVRSIKVWDGNPADTKTAGLLFNDYLDGIDIQFTDLRLFRNYQCAL